jgi:hypothetical protein
MPPDSPALQVVFTFPPRYKELDARFQVRGRPVIFTFGLVVHNPGRIKISPELMVHEGVHSKRQGADVDGWWTDYIADPLFRLCEEMPAHIAEYADVCNRFSIHKAQQRALHLIAARISGPLYGGMIDYREARERIESGAHSVLQSTDRAL